MKPSLCLNMIVKNEAARIDRCLNSILPYVKSVAILDTGSTDDTIQMIYAACKAQGIPAIVCSDKFENFSQARNAAFAMARDYNGKHDLPRCQFALLVDADMELVVTDPAAFAELDARAAAYTMIQKAGATLTYGNTRLINLDTARTPYIGVTHEYVDLPAAGLVTGAHFNDYADGANRVNKFQRDAELLNKALVDEPNNGRYWFYLGNTYRDWGQPALAADAYEKRIALGGWDEETQNAMMNLACMLKDQGDHAGFTSKMIQAFGLRPCRAEPLHDLAKYYRERGENAAALIFAKAGLTIERPNDFLFVNDYAYSHGLRYEYSIVGFYDEKERARASQVTDDLALDPTCPSHIRSGARNNVYWITKPLIDYCPSFEGKRIEFTPPTGYTATNPSVEVHDGQIYCNIRTVNYVIDEHGRYMIGPKQCGDAPIDTRNFLCHLSDTLHVTDAKEILWHRPPPAWDMVTGLEDIRLWRDDGQQAFSATVREQSPNGTCQMIQGKLAYDIDPQFMHVTSWEILSDEQRHEKNWMPAGNGEFMYRLDTPCSSPIKLKTDVYVDEISGSSQLIPFKHGWLAVVHEASNDPNGKRTYWHRFAWFEQNFQLRRLSLPFVFYDKQIEFCAGLAQHPNNQDLIISFGVRDAEAHIATVSIEEVARMCWKFHEG